MSLNVPPNVTAAWLPDDWLRFPILESCAARLALPLSWYPATSWLTETKDGRSL